MNKNVGLKGPWTEEELEIQKTLLQMAKQPGNNVCCDCSCKMVSWASINIGCFLCYECAGQHRNLGTHISQVRSLTLDRWKPQWLKNMIGNEAVNKKYLARLPKDKKQPDEHDQSGREHWIKWKYQDKRWYQNVSNQQDDEPQTSYGTTTSVSQSHIQEISQQQQIKVQQPLQQVQHVQVPQIQQSQQQGFQNPFSGIFDSPTQQQPSQPIQSQQPQQPQQETTTQTTQIQTELSQTKSQRKINELDDLLGFFDEPVIEQVQQQQITKKRLQFDW